jgi:solute carrier family 25 carnitine/acylcarnitine transporter 20/29|mmetsp:Transcript_10105/g.22352  ORF Transcript_10105/g.22352 Transcript_10105/m.22352 type:complete len:349 (-) Transcript_10105:19-1065(-)
MSTTTTSSDISSPNNMVKLETQPTKPASPSSTTEECCKKTTSPPKSESALKSFISGGVGGACCVMVGHPLDLVKVRMQTGGATAGASVFGMLSNTMKKEGVRGLYRGVSAPLTAVTPMFAISFWSYDIGQRMVKSYGQWGMNEEEKLQPYQLSMGEICMAGAISAIPTTGIMAPSERIKCLLQVQANEVEKGGKAKYTGMTDCARQILKEGGMASLYKGTVATLMRDIPGTVAYFGTYELAKKELMKIQGIDPNKGQLSPVAVLTAGGLAGMACWGVGIPADVIKSRYQTAPEGKYSGIYDVYKTLIKEEGYGGLVKGMRPALIRAFPANAACFLGMEVSKKMLGFMD